MKYSTIRDYSVSIELEEGDDSDSDSDTDADDTKSDCVPHVFKKWGLAMEDLKSQLRARFHVECLSNERADSQDILGDEASSSASTRTVCHYRERVDNHGGEEHEQRGDDIVSDADLDPLDSAAADTEAPSDNDQKTRACKTSRPKHPKN